MNAGTNTVHHEDLNTEMKHKIGSDGKTLGKLKTKDSVRDGKTAMGNANAVQAEEDVNTGSVSEAIASEANRAQLSQENEEIMKQLDLDSMYKKLSPAAKKPVAKTEKKPANKVNLQ
jgi:hypothetical protein